METTRIDDYALPVGQWHTCREDRGFGPDYLALDIVRLSHSLSWGE